MNEVEVGALQLDDTRDQHHVSSPDPIASHHLTHLDLMYKYHHRQSYLISDSSSVTDLPEPHTRWIFPDSLPRRQEPSS